MPKVMIDPGHGGADPGAVASGFSLREKDLTLFISKHIDYYLTTNYEVQTKMTREKDQTLNLKQRTDMANKWGADFLVSVHVNAGGGTGYEDFIYINLSDSSKTAKYRDIVHAEIKKVLDKYKIRDRGKKKANLHMLRESKMSAILTENLFIDNPEDQKLLKNETFLKQMAEAHAIGIAKALGLKQKSKPQPVKKAPSTEIPGNYKNMYRVIVDGKQIGAWSNASYLLRNVEKAVEGGGKEIKIVKV